MRGTGKPICALTLSNTAAGDEFAVRVQPPCDPVVTRFGPATWQMDRGEIVLQSARGQTWRFEEGEDQTLAPHSRRPPIRCCWCGNSPLRARLPGIIRSTGNVLASGKQKLERMRDGRAVYIGAERVDDVTAIRRSAKARSTIAGLYDLKADPAKRDLFSFEEDGERISLYWLRCRNRDDLARRMRCCKAIADATYGFVGRSPDQVSGLVTGLAMNAGLLDRLHPGFGAEPAALLRPRAQERSLSQLRGDAGERPQERRAVSRTSSATIPTCRSSPRTMPASPCPA